MRPGGGAAAKPEAVECPDCDAQKAEAKKAAQEVEANDREQMSEAFGANLDGNRKGIKADFSRDATKAHASMDELMRDAKIKKVAIDNEILAQQAQGKKLDIQIKARISVDAANNAQEVTGGGRPS